jgi:uroporphyrinogen decarboxylase
MKPHIDPNPDFSRFRDVLLLRRAWRRPPLFDFHIDRAHKARLLGRPVETAADETRFFALAGYDYIQITVRIPHEELDHVIAQEKQSSDAASHGGHARLIHTPDQFNAQRWSWQPLAEGDLSAVRPRLDYLQQVADALPPGMKIVLHTDDVFTFTWQMMGFTELCLSIYEQPELVRDVMRSLAAASRRIVDAAIACVGDRIGAVMYSDDIAYTEGLMCGPDFFRSHLFPHLLDLSAAAETIDAPLIYHSDGRLYDVFDDLSAAGVRAIQPLEPKSMDPLEIQRRWPGRFCLLGNIDLDLMTRGEPDEVEHQVRDRMDTLNTHGGYMPGVSNTVPHYVRYENYIRMIETVYRYPDHPI